MNLLNFRLGIDVKTKICIDQLVEIKLVIEIGCNPLACITYKRFHSLLIKFYVPTI